MKSIKERDFILDPSLVLYLPLWKRDGTSIISDDAYGHSCTVTGAFWTPFGGDFDGTDDKITLGSTLNLNYNNGVTIEVWAKPDTAQNGCFTSFSATTRNIFQFSSTGIIYFGDMLGGFGRTAVGQVTDDTWGHYVGIAPSILGQAVLFYKNTVSVANSNPVNGDMVNTWTNGQIGERLDADFDFKGIIGEIRIYNRALHFGEIARNYLRTKWRYQ